MFAQRSRFDGSCRRQRGFALLLALLFVAFFGGILATVAAFNNNQARQSEAQAAGWEGVEIAKAARLYVRDQMTANAAYRTVVATPQVISIPTLIAGGYLPATFGRLSGGNYVNALNQRIYVYVTNWSPGGMGGAPTSATTVPAAFVLFDHANGNKGTARLVIDTVAYMQSLGASIIAPLFNGAGVNLSATCRSAGPAVGLWDTGCMTAGEFSTIAGATGLSHATFTQGSLIIPAWKVTKTDLRAVMRYPQPENTGYSTMMTDLDMGVPEVENCPATANQVAITATDASGNPTTVYTGLCKVLSDTATADMRYNVMNVANMGAERVISAPQTTDFGGEAATFGSSNDQTMALAGNLRLGNSLRVFSTRPLGGLPARLDIPNGSLAVERNAYVYSQNIAYKGSATIGTIPTANSLLSGNVSTPKYISTDDGTTTGAAQMNITSSETISGSTSVATELRSDTVQADAGGGRVGATLYATDPALTGKVEVSNTLQMGGQPLNVTNTSAINTVDTDGTVYTAITGDINNAGEIKVTNNITFLSGNGSLTVNGSTRNADGSGYMPGISASNGGGSQCLEGLNVANACPNRQYFPPVITP